MIIIRNLQKKIPIYPKRIKKAILKVLSGEGITKKVELTVCFVNDAAIKKLNKKYHKRDKTTDVLAFNLGAKDKILADIAISADTAEKNAEIHDTDVQYELSLYAVHGVLHLLGYDDHTKPQSKLMRRKEEAYVN